MVHRNLKARPLSGNVKKQHAAYPDQHFYEVLHSEYPGKNKQKLLLPWCINSITLATSFFNREKFTSVFKDFIYGNENHNGKSYVSFVSLTVRFNTLTSGGQAPGLAQVCVGFCFCISTTLTILELDI